MIKDNHSSVKRKPVCDIWAIPELPSGRKVALDCSPVRDAIDRAVASGQANQLLTFKKHNLICQLLDVVEIYKDPLVPEEEQEEVEVSPGKRERFLTKHTGFTASEFMYGDGVGVVKMSRLSSLVYVNR
jgi:hypothetical protein